MKRWSALPLLLVLAFVASVRGVESAPAPVGQAGALGQGMNVLVVTIDSLRQRSLATYGYERSTMPSLEAWAADAVVFPHAYSTSAWTFPGVGSLLTGLYAGRHGLDARDRELRDVPTLHGILRAAGYRVPTVAHYSGTPWFGAIDFEPRWENPRTGKRGGLVEWLGSTEARERPFIAWDHWRGSHLPYDPPPPYDTAFGAGTDSAAADLVRSYVVIPAAVQAFGPADRGPVMDQYDASLRWTDDRWAEVQAALEANGLADNTIVVVTADHGEELLEHGLVGHASTTTYAQLFEEVLQIPLMIYVPGATLQPPQCRVSQVDVLPTLLALLGLPIPPDLDGRDLSAILQGAPCPEVPIYAESIQGGFQARGDSSRTFLWAVRDGDQKLILTRSDDGEHRQLYALDEDPEELHDIAAADPETVGRLDALLQVLIDRNGGDDYWRGRPDAAAYTGRMATEVFAAPEILEPLDGATLEFESTEGAIAGTWSGSPAASYVIEYDVGEGANRTQGTFEIEGNRYEFGPVPAEVWRNLSQFNPWRLRIWPEAAPDKKSRWATFTVAPPAASQPQLQRQHGVAWVAGRRIDAAGISPLVEHHVEWIAQTPFGWQTASDSPEIRLVVEGQVLWGETDEGLRETTELARARGIQTMLKPHIWVGRGDWRGDIYMTTDQDWHKWFADYQTFILHYARFAEENGIPLLCIGTELHRTILARPSKWSELIVAIRAVYSGELTYAANWYEEFQAVPFWEELDYIGVQGYFPLTADTDPDVETLMEGWRPHLDAIREVQARVGRPVLFTEIGYRSWDEAAERPWEWPERDDDSGFDAVLQQRLYEAFFRTFWHQDWMAGAYWWKWFPGHAAVGGQGNIGFTPQNKLAADVMSAWYSGASPE